MATLSWWMEWSVENVREAFFSYFGENQHVRLPSTPVIPVDDPNVPLLHTCLHRFKGTLGGRERHRTCFSLRCIIASGDEDLIDRFRIDATFHRFTEILGNWPHGYYFKEEAIGLLFSLLTEKYKLPQSRIYASYFSGDMSSCLSSVDESRNTLQKYIGAEKSCLPCPRLIFGCPVKLVLVGHVLVFSLIVRTTMMVLIP